MIRDASRVASQRQSAVIADIAASAAEAIERRTYREPDVLSVGISSRARPTRPSHREWRDLLIA